LRRNAIKSAAPACTHSLKTSSPARLLPPQRRRAREYIKLVLAQRVGPVTIDFNEPRDDLSVVIVPEDCVGYVMGRQGTALRGMEEEWGTLMVFAKVDGTEKLAIFGTRRARRGAELKVMSAVEHKHAGYFVNSRSELRADLSQPGDDWKDGWGYDLVRPCP
jgi:predicted PilT family ATPase